MDSVYKNVHYMNLDRFLKFSLSVSDLYLFTLLKQYKRNSGLLGLGSEIPVYKYINSTSSSTIQHGLNLNHRSLACVYQVTCQSEICRFPELYMHIFFLKHNVNHFYFDIH